MAMDDDFSKPKEEPPQGSSDAAKPFDIGSIMLPEEVPAKLAAIDRESFLSLAFTKNARLLDTAEDFKAESESVDAKETATECLKALQDFQSSGAVVLRGDVSYIPLGDRVANLERERRFRYVPISWTEMRKILGGRVRLRVDGAPTDSVVIDITLDNWRRVIGLLIVHESFDRVTDGAEIPWVADGSVRCELVREERQSPGTLAGKDHAWQETAAQAQRNCDYYRSLVVDIGAMLGTAAYTTDAGETVPDVLCAKVPELVREMKNELTALREELAEYEEQAEQVRMDRNLLD